MKKHVNLESISIIDPVGGYGGMDYYDYGLSYGLSTNKLEVLYFSCNSTSYRDFENVTLYTPFGNIWKVNKFKRGYYFIKGYLNSFIKSKKLNSEVFHFHFFDLGFLNVIVLVLASFFYQKKVVTLHDLNPFYGRPYSFLEKIAVKLIDGIIVHNQTSKKELLKKGLKVHKIAIIPHGNYFPFVSMLPEPKIGKVINLLFFGQIKEVKGLDILLKAMKIVVNENTMFKLTIAGKPWKIDSGIYEKMIVNYGLDNFVERQFHFIEDNEVEFFFQKADVVILPYKQIYQSGVLLLTLSYGRTVITSDLKPFKDIITHNINGFIFESENAESLANCILKLNQENILKTTLNSKDLIKDKFNWSKIGCETIRFYKTV
ncbi:glycosyltransferase [Yeosuana sp.]|uniref:glycosyltransferase n=1 Tax=Yeosuana sp. TaxID=2529388 RepID=UPI004055129B